MKKMYEERIKALEDNRELLRKCREREFPFDGFDDKGKPVGGESSKTYQVLFDTVINMEMELDDMLRSMRPKKESPKYKNLLSYAVEHEKDQKCYSCRYIGDINGEIICKNPKMSITSVNGVMSCYELSKFDSFIHHFLKISPNQTRCRCFRSSFDDDAT